jgi:hypothetical protein
MDTKVIKAIGPSLRVDSCALVVKSAFPHLPIGVNPRSSVVKTKKPATVGTVTGWKVSECD